SAPMPSSPSSLAPPIRAASATARFSCRRSSTPCAFAPASMARARCETQGQEEIEMTGSRWWGAAGAGLARAGAVVAPGSPGARQSGGEGQVQAQAQTPPAPVPVQEPPKDPAQQTDVQTQGPAAGAAPVAEEKGPNTGRVALLMGVDWASAYYFRGIANFQN